MKQLKKKIFKILFRHPGLYYIRYILLSKNHKGKSAEAIGCFNDLNPINEIPKLYFDVNKKISINPGMDELEKALEIGRFLRNAITGGTGLGLSSAETLAKMLEGKGGVCSDFAQIFNLFCCINNIKVKEWGCIDRFYKTRFGHSFNEIYSSELQKWIAIDIHKSIVFSDGEKSQLFSVTELFHYLRDGNPLKLIFFSAYIPRNVDRIPHVYSKNTIPFIISNYKNNVNDYFCNRFKNFPPFIINAIMIVLRKNYAFVFVMDNYKTKLLPKYFQNTKPLSLQ